MSSGFLISKEKSSGKIKKMHIENFDERLQKIKPF